MKPLKLEVLFGSQDKLSPALKLMVGSSNAASKALKATRDEIKKLNDQQKQIDGFTKQKKATEDSAKALKDVQDRIKSLRQEMASNPSDKISKDFDKATKEAKKLKDAHSQNQAKLQELRNELKQTGVSTSNLADHQSELSRKITTANASIDNQKKKLDSLNRIQKSHSNISGNVRTAALYGAGMAATGSAALFAMRKPIDESKNVDVEQNRIASLGFGKKATEEAIQYARAMKTFGTSTLDNLTLVRDGVTAFGDVHHAQWVAPTLAKMKFANEAMYGDHGVENEKKFMDMLKVIEMRNGLKSKESFQEQANIIQQVITATGGRVQAEEWLNVIKTGGIAAKGMDNKAFYYKMEPLVQEMGGHRVGTSMMSAYQNLYQGRTTQRAAANLDKFGLIGDYSKVKHNKTGDLSYLDIGAIKGADLFKKDQFAWMEKVLVPALNAKGITKESDVIDAIGSIFSNRTASNLFAQMYMQRDQIHKNAKLNEGAFNIDQLNTQAQGTTSGKELEARAKLNNAYLQFGQTILPIYTQALVLASSALQSFTGWMQQNPTLAKALGTGLLLIAGGLVAIGGLLLVFSPLILSMLSLRLMMATLGVQGGLLTRLFSGLGTSSIALTTRFSSVISKVSALSGVLRTSLTTAWLASSPKGFISSLRQLPSVMKIAITNAWMMTKTFGAGLYTSFVNAARGVWAFATALTTNAVVALRNYVFAASIAIRTNGLLGASKILLRNAVLGLWSVLSGGAVGMFAALATGARVAAQSVLFLSRALLMNPIGLIITGIAGAAFLIYKYWQPIKAFFQGFWQGLTEGIAPLSAAFAPLFQTLGSALAPLKPVWDWLINSFKTAWQWVSQLFQPFQATKQQLDSATNSGKAFGLWLAGLVNTVAGLVGKFFNFGANIIDGLINGIKSGFAKLKSVWKKVTSYVPSFFTKTMEIHSPSRVMAELGGHVVGGIGMGLTQAFPELKNKYNQVLNLFTNKAQSPAMDQIDIAAPVISKIQTAPNLTSSRQSSLAVAGDTYTIHIHAAPGQMVQDLERQIEQVFNRLQRDKLSRVRTIMADQE